MTAKVKPEWESIEMRTDVPLSANGWRVTYVVYMIMTLRKTNLLVQIFFHLCD